MNERKTEKAPLRAVLFDLDGTLTDPGEGITRSVEYALGAYGIEVEDRRELYPFIGPPLSDSFSRFYGFSEEEALRAVEKYREYYRDRGIFENRVYEGIPALLDALQKRGLSLLLATSKPEEFAKRILDRFDLSPYFTAVFGATMDGSRVEKEDVLRYALEKSALSPEECLMVGDRCFDVEGARRVGMPAIAVTWGYGSREELAAAKPLALTESTEDLLSRILALL
jgi:phosphoglycolate phosphatase